MHRMSRGPIPFKLKINELIDKTVHQTKTLEELRAMISPEDKTELDKLDCVLRFMRGFKSDLQNLLK